jgi:hypothetical protein
LIPPDRAPFHSLRPTLIFVGIIDIWNVTVKTRKLFLIRLTDDPAQFSARHGRMVAAQYLTKGSERPFAAVVTKGRLVPFLTVVVERIGLVAAPGTIRREGRRAAICSAPH